MLSVKLSEFTKTIKKNKIFYILEERGKIKKYKPWLGDIFSFLYDKIMEKSVFPKKFSGSITKHHEFLKEEYKGIHNCNVLEIATGSGVTAYLLNNDNLYTGIDISTGLLTQAVRKFSENNFSDAEFYVCSASDLPFNDEFFDVVICDLSLNFLGDPEPFIKGLKRIMKNGASFYCSVPVPERKDTKATIHGNLLTECELQTLFERFDFSFMPRSFKNGALLYFEAVLGKKQNKE
jgi:ubiquinone/menaquinone biosynthesis C-methylase UbiE